MRVLTHRVLPKEVKAVTKDLAEITAQLKAGNALNLGDTGTAVAALQRQLASAGLYSGPVNGTFDAVTAAAVTALQKAKGLAASGIVGGKTLTAIRSTDLFVKDGFEKGARVGQSGSDILRAEKMLEKLGFRPGSADGIFDKATAAAVERHRRADKQVTDKGHTIGKKFFSKREIGNVKQHNRLDALTARAAAKTEGIGPGAKGRAVLNVQKHLEAAGYELGAQNSIFGSRTGAAIKAFQKSSNLAQTGVVDAKTWAKLKNKLFAATNATSPAQRLNERDASVKRTEAKLKFLGFKTGKVDGLFSAATEKSVKAFQKKNHIKVNGAVGAGTLRAIDKALKTRQGGITQSQLHQIMPNLSAAKARLYLPFLNKAMGEMGITTEKRKEQFIAQLAHESGGLRYMEEIASGAAYEGRRDLGNVRPGDGKRYKGRGPIQLTGRANYRSVGRALGLNLEANPKLAAKPAVAFRIAAYFWKSHGLNALADRGDFLGITRRINGGTNGLASRRMYLARARKAI